MAGKATGYYIHLRRRPETDGSGGESRTIGPFPGPVHVYAACAVYVDPSSGGREVLHWSSRDGWYVVGMAEWHGYTDFALSTGRESPYGPDGR